MDNSKVLKKLYTLIALALVVAVISFAASVIKNIVIERWAKSRDTVACIPADTANSFPLVYAQTAAHPVQDDALIKSFVEEYIRYSQNENIVDYHRQSSNGRYIDANISESRTKAIEMTAEGTPERALALMKFAESDNVYRELKKSNYGWIFLIDDIQIISRGGVTVAVVNGEFQVTYDKVKAPLPDELWGYREIVLLLNQGFPTKDTQGNFLNKHGIFVAHSNSRILSAEDRSARLRRGFDYYMKGNDE